jgi:hypothetical protein
VVGRVRVFTLRSLYNAVVEDDYEAIRIALARAYAIL